MRLDNKEVPNTYFVGSKKPKPLGNDGYWMMTRRNLNTNRPEAWQWVTGVQDVSMDELPPPGFETGELTKTPPSVIGGVTPSMLQQQEKRGGGSSFIAHSGEALDDK